MGALAKELGVTRATRYSGVGSRERLIGEVLWSFVEQGKARRAQAPGTGADHIVDVFDRFTHANASFAPLRRFIEQDAELALAS